LISLVACTGCRFIGINWFKLVFVLHRFNLIYTASDGTHAPQTHSHTRTHTDRRRRNAINLIQLRSEFWWRVREIIDNRFWQIDLAMRSKWFLCWRRCLLSLLRLLLLQRREYALSHLTERVWRKQKLPHIHTRRKERERGELKKKARS